MNSHPLYKTLPVEPNEVVDYFDSFGTLHRSFDPCYAASNMAAYCYIKPLFRKPKWLRFPYSLIESVQIQAIPQYRLLFSVLVLIFSLTILWFSFKYDAIFKGVIYILSFSFFTYLSYKSLRGRYKLILNSNNRKYVFAMPSDGYDDLRSNDFDMLKNFVDALSGHGVLVKNE